MTDFKALDPQTRCYALVGMFLSQWAFMEARVNAVIGKTLDLGILQEAVVCSNLEFRRKIYILRSSLSHSLAASSEEEKKSFNKMLVSLEKLSEYRNRIAHHMFVPSEDEMGVQFFVTKATAKLEFPKMVWSVDDFTDKIYEIVAASGRLDELKSKIGKSALLAALMKREESKEPFKGLGGGLFGLGGGFLSGATPGLLSPIIDENTDDDAGE